MFSTVSETTLRETMPQQSAPVAPSAEESRLVLGNKQIAATAFVVLTLITVIATLSYIVGRTGREAGAEATPEVVKAANPVPAPAAEQVIIVEPKPEASASAPVVPSAPGSSTPLPASFTTATVEPGRPAVTAPWNPDLAPAAGTVFFQVASVDKGMADVSVQYLQEKGFAARRAPGASAGLYRVLVGPLEAGPAMAATEAKLKDLGFTPFPKKY